MSMLQRAKQFLTGPDKRRSRERRKLKRMACHQAFVCTRGEKSFPITVIDVGFGGFKVISEEPLGERGDLLHIRRVSTDFRRHLTGAYTTGLMVRIAWTKQDGSSYESGLHLPKAPGSMRIIWFRELLSELGMDEKAVFTKRKTRRFRCRLPAVLKGELVPAQDGTLLDLSSGGGLFGSTEACSMGDSGEFEITWGKRSLKTAVDVVGVRRNDSGDGGVTWLNSVKFKEELSKPQERVLFGWLEELSRNE